MRNWPPCGQPLRCPCKAPCRSSSSIAGGIIWGPKGTEFLADWVNQPAPIIVRANKIRYRAEARTASLPRATAVPGFPTFYTVTEPPLPLLEEGACYVQEPQHLRAAHFTGTGETHVRVGRLRCTRWKDCAHGATDVQPRQDPGGGQRGKTRASPGWKISRIWESSLPRRSSTTGWRDHCRRSINNVSQMALIASSSIAPCSNTGVMRRRVDVRWRLQPDDFVKMQQQAIAVAGGHRA